MSYGDEAILLQLAATSVLYPKKDWREIDPLHAQMVTFRAIENGFSVVSQAVGGLSVAVDDEDLTCGAGSATQSLAPPPPQKVARFGLVFPKVILGMVTRVG